MALQSEGADSEVGTGILIMCGCCPGCGFEFGKHGLGDGVVLDLTPGFAIGIFQRFAVAVESAFKVSRISVVVYECGEFGV